MMDRRCTGEAQDSYPGLAFQSDIGSKNCSVSQAEWHTQTVRVVNSSLLTFHIRVRSLASKDLLEYEEVNTQAIEQDADFSVWDERFDAPYRWNGQPRTTERATRIIAVEASRATQNCEVAVHFSCAATGYTPVGPYDVLLQVDTTVR